MKRPMVFAAAAFVLGELCVEYFQINISAAGRVCFFLLAAGVFLLSCFYYVYRKCLAVIFLCLCAGILGIYGMARQKDFYQKYEQLPDGESCLVHGIVREISKGTDSQRLVLDILQACKTSGEELPDRVKILLTVPGSELKVGNQILALVEKKDFSACRNDGNFDEKSYYYAKGIAAKAEAETFFSNQREEWLPGFLQNVRQRLCENLDKACGSVQASVIKAILYGDKSSLDEDVKLLYTENGIAHILAVSGLHMSLVGLGIYGLLRRYCSYPVSALLAGCLITLFGLMTGFGISAKRALLMLLMRMLADVLGRAYDMKNAIAFSILLLLLEQPYYLYQTAFLLSYASMMALGFVYPEFQNWFKESCKNSPVFLKPVQHIGESLLAGFVLWYCSLPVTAELFFQIPVYSVFLNLLVIPLVSILFVSGMAASLLLWICKPMGIFAAGAAQYIVDIYIQLCEWTEELPCSHVVTGKLQTIQFIGFYVFLCLLLLLFRFTKQFGKRNAGIAVFLLVCSISFIFYRDSEQEMLISMIDVGQGDCFLVRNKNGTTYLIDGGSSSIKNVAKYRIVPYLKSKGIGKLDYVFLSHSDSDHINAIQEMLEKNLLDIGVIAVSGKQEFLEGYQDIFLLAKQKGISVVFLHAQDRLREKELCFQVLGPLQESYSDVNSASLVLRMDYRKFSMCFTGDMDKNAETMLLGKIGPVQILKIAHHGSDTASSEAFLRESRPLLSLISCGEHNRYGHPHQETLEALDGICSQVLVSAECGGVEIRIDDAGNISDIRSMKKE